MKSRFNFKVLLALFGACMVINHLLPESLELWEQIVFGLCLAAIYFCGVADGVDSQREKL